MRPTNAPEGPWEHGYATVNGLKLHYLTMGSGFPMVMLHGWPQTSYCWRKIMPAMAERFTVVAPDLRGFGDSDKPDSGYEQRTLALDILKLMRSLGHERAVVVGQDWGGTLSYVIALEHPPFVDRLVVLDTVIRSLRHGKPFNPEIWYTKFFEIPELPEKMLQDHIGEFVKHFLLHWSHRNHYTEEDLAEYARAYRLPGSIDGMLRHYRMLPHDRQQFEQYASRTIDVPTLILWGEHDKPIPATNGDGIHRYVKNLTYKLIRDAGHFIQEEAPDEVIREMRAYLTEFSTGT